MRRQTAEGIISSDEAAAHRCLVIPPSDDGGDDATAAPRDIGTWAGRGGEVSRCRGAAARARVRAAELRERLVRVACTYSTEAPGRGLGEVGRCLTHAEAHAEAQTHA